MCLISLQADLRTLRDYLFDLCERTRQRADGVALPFHELPIIGEQISELHERALDLYTKLGWLVSDYHSL